MKNYQKPKKNDSFDKTIDIINHECASDVFLLQMTKHKTIQNISSFIQKIKTKQKSIWPYLGIISSKYYKMTALLTIESDAIEITRIFIDHESRHQNILVQFIDALKKIGSYINVHYIKMGCITSQRMLDIMEKNKMWKRCEHDPSSFITHVF